MPCSTKFLLQLIFNKACGTKKERLELILSVLEWIIHKNLGFNIDFPHLYVEHNGDSMPYSTKFLAINIYLIRLNILWNDGRLFGIDIII